MSEVQRGSNSAHKDTPSHCHYLHIIPHILLTKQKGRENSCLLCHSTWQKCSDGFLDVLFVEWIHMKVIIFIINVNKSFSIWVLLTFWAAKFFVMGCPGHCWIFSSVPNPYSVDVSSTPSDVTTKPSLDAGKYPLGSKITLSWELI